MHFHTTQSNVSGTLHHKIKHTTFNAIISTRSSLWKIKSYKVVMHLIKFTPWLYVWRRKKQLLSLVWKFMTFFMYCEMNELILNDVDLLIHVMGDGKTTKTKKATYKNYKTTRLTTSCHYVTLHFLFNNFPTTVCVFFQYHLYLVFFLRRKLFTRLVCTLRNF